MAGPASASLPCGPDETTWVIGRAEQADVVIDDPTLSRMHLAVALEGGALVVRDLGSGNGTFVDGLPVPAAGARLEPGSVLAAGECLWVVDRPVDEEALPAVQGADDDAVTEWVGDTPLSRRVRASLATVAPLDDVVLLLGPTGVGKEVAATALHRLSGRVGAFVPVNCAAIPVELAEATLFGHERGAFTGAVRAGEGLFARAHEGTLFLDELGELPEPLQAKLLRVVETGEVWPVGGTKGVIVDVRVIAATHRRLDGDGFRADLYARLSDWVLRLPPLAARPGDALALFRHFNAAAAAELELSAEAREACCLYPWPENAREVRKLVARLQVLVSGRETVGLGHLPAAMTERLAGRTAHAPAVAREDRDEAPSRYELVAALKAARGNVAHVARLHGWHRTQVYRWLEREHLDPRAFR